MVLTFIESPFPTKVAYKAWLRLPATEQPTALARASLAVAPPPSPSVPTIERQESTVLTRVLDRTDLVEALVAVLPLAEVALIAAEINHIFRDVARARIHALWPTLSPLLEAPFSLRREAADAEEQPDSVQLSRHDLLQLEELDLSFHELGETGAKVLADGCASGALAQLKALFLNYHQTGYEIGDAGLSALADACGRGALAQLMHLDLAGNQIGDPGLASLSDACARGALAQLQKLNLYSNKIGDIGVTALAQVIKPVSEGGSGAALAQCQTLWLSNNSIGDAGLSALADACAKGALASLKHLCVVGNPGNVEAVKEACKKRGIEYVE